MHHYLYQTVDNGKYCIKCHRHTHIYIYVQICVSYAEFVQPFVKHNTVDISLYRTENSS